MGKNWLIIGLVLIGISSILIIHTLNQGPLVDTKFADVEWGVEALSYSYHWANGPVIESFVFDEETILNINFTFINNDSEIVDFFIVDQDNYIKWESNQTATKHLLTKAVNSLNVNWTTPFDSTWYFIWDTTTHDSTVWQLRIKLTHYEILPFGEKIIIDNRSFFILQLFMFETGIVFIGYSLLKEISKLI